MEYMAGGSVADLVCYFTSLLSWDIKLFV